MYVGLDSAAATFAAAWLRVGGTPSTPLTRGQDPAGYTVLQDRLPRTTVRPADTRVVPEAPGSYWVALAVTLHGAGYAVSVINPLQARHCAKAQLRRAKTDHPDAQDLAQLAATLRPARWTPPPAIFHAARQRLLTRDAPIAMRQQARKQRRALLPWPVVSASVRQHLDAGIADLDGRIDGLAAEVAAVLAERAWAASVGYLTSAPGSGLLTAAWLRGTTRNCTRCTNPAAATAYAGLAPMPRAAGRSVRGRRRSGHAGNARLRTALYRATRSAAQHHPLIKPCYKRLVAAGKLQVVARCAAARKLLHLAWALVTQQQHSDPAIQPHHPVPLADPPATPAAA